MDETKKYTKYPGMEKTVYEAAKINELLAEKSFDVGATYEKYGKQTLAGENYAKSAKILAEAGEMFEETNHPEDAQRCRRKARAINENKLNQK